MKLLKKLLLVATTFATFSLGLTHAQALPSAQETRAEVEKLFGFTPLFIQMTPEAALPGAWHSLSALELNPNTALSGKAKELIGLAVASQIPCRFCIYGHTEFAKLDGATKAELGEAVSMAAITRHWSTVLNGIQLDEASFRADIQRMIAASGTSNPAAVVDARTALSDIKQRFGFVPAHLNAVPPETLPGVWVELASVQIDPKGALPGKLKSLIGLSVASQIPCRYCVIADTEFAKAQGATEREIKEAVGMAALTRHWSTLFHGVQLDETSHRRDIDRLVAGVKASKASSTSAAKKR